MHSQERSLDQDNCSEKRDSELAPDAAFEDEGEEEGVRQDEEGMLDRPQPMEDLRKDGSTKESDYLTRCIRGTSTLVEVGVEALSHGSNDFCLFFTHPTMTCYDTPCCGHVLAGCDVHCRVSFDTSESVRVF